MKNRCKSRKLLNVQTNISIFHGFLFFAAESQSKPRRGTIVSRPPSSYITRVDEEPTTTASKTEEPQAHRVETVDRGVGPTPLPPHNVDQRLPTYFGVTPPFIDPRNGLIDQSPYSEYY